jgi:hypothetical protein
MSLAKWLPLRSVTLKPQTAAAATVQHLDAIAVDDGSVKQKTRRVSETIKPPQFFNQ